MAVEIPAVGRPRKLPWKWPRNSADFRGNHRVSENRRGNGRVRPWMAVEIAAVGRPRKLPWQLPRTSTEFVVITAYRRIAVAMAADDCGWPWKLLRSGIRGNCRDNCRGLPRTFVVIGALPWQWLRMAMEIATAVSAETSVAIATDFHELP